MNIDLNDQKSSRSSLSDQITKIQLYTHRFYSSLQIILVPFKLSMHFSHALTIYFLSQLMAFPMDESYNRFSFVLANIYLHTHIYAAPPKEN